MQTTEHAQDNNRNQTNAYDGFSSTVRNGKRKHPEANQGFTTQPNGKRRRNWLNELGVADGEWYMNPIARPQRLMEISLSPLASRIYACLDLCTMNFSQELAVISVQNEKTGEWTVINLTSTHLATRLKADDANIRCGLRELKAAGLCDVRPINGTGLHKGNVGIYSWARPRKVEKPPDDDGFRLRATPFLAKFGDEFAPLKTVLARLKFKIPEDLGPISDTPELADSSRNLFLEAQEVARQIAELEKEVERIAEKGFRDVAYLYSLSRRHSDVCLSEEEPPPEDRQTESEPEPEAVIPPPPEPSVALDPIDVELDELITQTAQKIRGEGRAVEEPGPSLRPTIREKLTGAPPDRLRQRAQQRMKRGDSLGKLIPIAKDIGEQWRREQLQATKTQEHKDAEIIEEWKRWLEPDSGIPLEDQEYARVQLRQRGLLSDDF